MAAKKKHMIPRAQMNTVENFIQKNYKSFQRKTKDEIVDIVTNAVGVKVNYHHIHNIKTSFGLKWTVKPKRKPKRREPEPEQQPSLFADPNRIARLELRVTFLENKLEDIKGSYEGLAKSIDGMKAGINKIHAKYESLVKAHNNWTNRVEGIETFFKGKYGV